MRAIPSIVMAAILAASVILAGCGHQVIVLDTDRYTPQDPILGPLPGNPQGDSIFENKAFSGASCNDIRITFFPTTLSTPSTGLSIPPGCSITLIAASHQFLSHGDSSRFYRVSWLGQGDGGPVQAVVTPLFSGVVDNSRSSLTITQDGVRYFAGSSDDEQKLAPLDGFGAAHRIVLDVPRSFFPINLRAESFNEGTPLNDAVEVLVNKPHGGINLAGINISVPFDASFNYILADLYVTDDRE